MKRYNDYFICFSMVLVTLLSLFIAKVEGGPSIAKSERWFTCCPGSVWEQLARNTMKEIGLEGGQKVQLQTLANEFAPTFEALMERQITRREQYIHTIASALSDDGRVDVLEAREIKEQLKRLHEDKLGILGLILQGKVLADSILTDDQIKRLRTMDLSVTIPSPLLSAITELKSVMASIMEEYERVGTVSPILRAELEEGFNTVIQEICVPKRAKDALNAQLQLVSSNLEFFLNEEQVQQVTGIDLSLQAMQAAITDIIEASEKGTIDALSLLEMTSRALGLPAGRTIARFGFVVRPIVMESFLITPCFTQCNL